MENNKNNLPRGFENKPNKQFVGGFSPNKKGDEPPVNFRMNGRRPISAMGQAVEKPKNAKKSLTPPRASSSFGKDYARSKSLISVQALAGSVSLPSAICSPVRV